NALNNAGVINVNAATLTDSITAPLNNTGTISVSSGALALGSSSNSNSGTINATGTFSLNGGTMNHGDGSNFRGPGTITLNGFNNFNTGTTTTFFGRLINASTINLSSGTLLIPNSTSSATYSDGAIFTGPGVVDLGTASNSLNGLNGSLTLASSSASLSDGT